MRVDPILDGATRPIPQEDTIPVAQSKDQNPLRQRLARRASKQPTTPPAPRTQTFPPTTASNPIDEIKSRQPCLRKSSRLQTTPPALPTALRRARFSDYYIQVTRYRRRRTLVHVQVGELLVT